MHHIPIRINKFNIYDIFHNDSNQLIIIAPYIPKAHTIKYISNDNKISKFNLYKCPHNHTYIYSLNINYNKKIKISVNDSIIETLVNKYPIFKNEIIFSTMVKNEDNYIKQWINFHLNIGITRFIIYDNAGSNDGLSYQSVQKNSNLKLLLKEYIDKKIVFLIKWDYPKRLKSSGISGQTCQQNHSIYAFKNSKYIGLFDIDEYVNMQENKNIHTFFEELINKEKINVENISTLRLKNKFFYNPTNLPTDNTNFFNIFNCDKITNRGHEKNFVIPKNVVTFSVHMVTSGKEMYNINEKYIYFNHYYYLNKSERGKNITDLLDNSILVHLH
jgi:hypothetical protein